MTREIFQIYDDAVYSTFYVAVEPIIVESGQFSWNSYEGSPTLIDINVKVQPGSLVAVVGPVGSGKSSLLSAILGEMYKQSGFVNTHVSRIPAANKVTSALYAIMRAVIK